MSRKNTLLSQVKEVLHQNGMSKTFNEMDFDYFKKRCKNAFNKAQAIADLFIEENHEANSDFNDYVF